MKIVNANTLKAKDVLLEMIGKIDVPKTKEAIDIWATLNLGTEMFNAWIAFDGDEPIGMITAEVVLPKDPSVFIAFNYVKPGCGINGQLVDKVEEWARILGIKQLLFYTKRSPMTFIKKYGFELVQSILRKAI